MLIFVLPLSPSLPTLPDRVLVVVASMVPDAEGKDIMVSGECHGGNAFNNRRVDIFDVDKGLSLSTLSACPCF